MDQVIALVSRLQSRAEAHGTVLLDLSRDRVEAAQGVGTLIRALDVSYLAVAEDAAAVGLLTDAGAEVVPGDPSAPASLAAAVGAALRGRAVVAVAVGDAPGRVDDLDGYLRDARALCGELGDAPLLVALPNVAHLDVAAKLLMGRWDTTPTGTLSSAHVRHFSGRALRTTMAAHGWEELDGEDRRRDDSDQHFPADAATLERTTPAGALLSVLGEMAGGGAHTDLLVRAYRPAATHRAAPGTTDTSDVAAPFLSVLLRTQGRRGATLQEALLCLAAQTCDDFEVLVLLHDGDAAASAEVRAAVVEFHESFSSRVRVVEVSGGGRCRPLNEGALRARGHYLAMLDDDDLVLADWVETFRDAAARSPGHVVRTAVATQRIEARPGAWGGEDGYEVVDRPRLVFALDFDHVDHILDNRTPDNGYAFPRSLVAEMGLRWDESLPVLEDWDHLLWSASICGVTGVPAITALLRTWEVGEDSKSEHAPELWEATRRRVIAKHDAAPLLLDCGTFSHLRARLIDGDVAAEHAERLDEELRRMSAELGSARAKFAAADLALGSARDALDELRGSTSWRITSGARLAARVARRATRKLRSP